MNLKRKLIIAGLMLAGPWLWSQKTDRVNLKTYSAGIKVLHLYDLPSYRFDGPLNRDMKGLNGANTKFDLGVDIYVEKQFTPLIGIQLGYRFAGLSGANEVEYYNNSFNAFSADAVLTFSNLDLRHINSDWNFYGRLGIGVGSFKAEQYLINDNAANFKNSNGFWEGRLGAGINYELNTSWRVELEVVYNVAYTDGFDGFDNATGTDPYLTTGVGVAYTFGKKENRAMYSINFFDNDYLNNRTMFSPATNPEVLDSSENKISNADIEEVRKQIAAQNKRLDEADRRIRQQKMELEKLRDGMEMSNSFTVYFESTSSVLSKEAKMQLASHLTDKTDKEKISLELAAFTDKYGSDEYNADLRRRRGESVKDFLVNVLGYEENSISIDQGETRDLVPQEQFLNRTVIVRY